MVEPNMLNQAREIVKEHSKFPPDAINAGLYDNSETMRCTIAALGAGGKAVAWRYKSGVGNEDSDWLVTTDQKLAETESHYPNIVEPLYAHPAPSGQVTNVMQSPFGVLTEELDGEKAISAIEALNRAGWTITRTSTALSPSVPVPVEFLQEIRDWLPVDGMNNTRYDFIDEIDAILKNYARTSG